MGATKCGVDIVWCGVGVVGMVWAYCGVGGVW